MKILTLDIETSPNIGYFWGSKWETNIIEVIEQMQIMSFSAKWYNGKQITLGWPQCKNEMGLLQRLHTLMCEADVLVGQNLKQFDLKVINARFLFYGMSPPEPYKIIDTKLEVKKYLKLTSNSLDDISAYYKLGRKMEHEGFPLWKACLNGNKKAWKKMLKYNAHDVVLTEKLYKLILPWMENHPNHGLYIDKKVCPNCGSTKLKSEGLRHTASSSYRRLICTNCHSWHRQNKSLSTVLVK